MGRHAAHKRRRDNRGAACVSTVLVVMGGLFLGAASAGVSPVDSNAAAAGAPVWNPGMPSLPPDACGRS